MGTATADTARGLAAVALLVGDEWGCEVTGFAVAVYAVLETDPLPVARGETTRRRGRAEGEVAAVREWARRQRKTRPSLLALAGRRGPRGEAALEVRRLREIAREFGRPAPPVESLATAAKEGDDVMAMPSAGLPPLSGMEAIHAYVNARRPCKLPTLRDWIYRPHDPLPVDRYGAGSKMVAQPADLDAWLERQKRISARRGG